MRTIAGCADAKRQRIDWLSSECFNSIRREPLGVGKVKIMHSTRTSETRSVRPSAHRYSIAILRPSIQSSSCSRCTKASVHFFCAGAVVAPKNPMVRSFIGCCAPAPAATRLPRL